MDIQPWDMVEIEDLGYEVIIRRSNTKHGLSHIPEYKTWKAMKNRCNNPKATGYQDYGGRGIKICDEWDKSFTAFLNHIGEKPSPRHSIDRIDVNGNYEPGNVRWATRWTQNINQRLRKDNKSGYKGVSWETESGKWVVQMTLSNGRKKFGRYNSLGAAVVARKKLEYRYGIR